MHQEKILCFCNARVLEQSDNAIIYCTETLHEVQGVCRVISSIWIKLAAIVTDSTTGTAATNRMSYRPRSPPPGTYKKETHTPTSSAAFPAFKTRTKEISGIVRPSLKMLIYLNATHTLNLNQSSSRQSIPAPSTFFQHAHLHCRSIESQTIIFLNSLT